MPGTLLALLLCFLHLPAIHPNREPSLDVTFIANEGFLIEMGGTKVLVDAVYQSKRYPSPSDTLVSDMINGTAPFDDIDFLLVTHDHGDHFSPDLVSRFIEKHPSTELVANTQVCQKLAGNSAEHWRPRGIDLEIGQTRSVRTKAGEVEAVRLGHSGNALINNLAFIVRSHGFTIVHVGDALLSQNEEAIRSIDWSKYAVDVLFLGAFDRGSPTTELVRDLIKPRHIVLMHIPSGEETAALNSPYRVSAQSLVFSAPLEKKRLGGGR